MRIKIAGEFREPKCYDCTGAGYRAVSPMEIVNFIWEKAGYTL